MNYYMMGALTTLAIFGLLTGTPLEQGVDFVRPGFDAFVAQEVGEVPAATLAVQEPKEAATRTVRATITAYSSTRDQTDSTPFITAAQTRVRDGIIATNCLPFGARVRLPELYGDKVFVVEDRMNSRYGCSRFDIWMETRSAAKQFGVKRTSVEILEEKAPLGPKVTPSRKLVRR